MSTPHGASAQDAMLYQGTLEQAVQAGPSIMANVLSKARQSLMGSAKQMQSFAERDRVAQSLSLLDNHQRELCAGYALALDDVFTKATPQAPLGPRSVASPQFDQLELMDSDQVQESVVMARAQQSVMLAAEMALAELNTYICAVLGLKAVQPERNPLRPEVFLQALQTVLLQVQVSPAIRMDWLHHMGAALGQELCGLYGTLSRWLADKGVAAAGYVVRRTNEGDRSASGWRAAPFALDRSPQRGDPVAAPDASVLTLDRLRKLLTGELDDASARPASSSFAEKFAREFESVAPDTGARGTANFQSTVPAALEALKEMNQVDHLIERIGSRRDAAVAGQPPLAPTVRQQLRRVANGVGQVLGQEVVALMVDNIAKDTRLLDPVKEVVKTIEPALLRLALVDPRFFSDKQHPARRLMQEITHRSLAYENLDTRGFSDFLEPLLAAVTPLIDQPIEDAQPFEKALSGLLALWDAKRPTSQLIPAMKALQQAETRHLLAEKMAGDIMARPDAVRVPQSVLEFLCGPWSQVMANARLNDITGEEDPGQYRELVLALLWSAQPELTRRNVAKLTRLIPKLLSKLREGLESIGYPALKTSAFFELLMNLHQQAFKPELASKAALPAVGLSPSLQAEVDPWIAPAEAKASGFMEVLEPAVPGTPSPPLQDGFDPLGAAQPLSAPPQVLPVGAWVEIRVNAVWVRSQLSWASPHGSLFLFTSADGSTQSMTRRSRDKLLSSGSMRVVSDQPLVDGALDAVVQTAMRNSIGIKP